MRKFSGNFAAPSRSRNRSVAVAIGASPRSTGTTSAILAAICSGCPHCPCTAGARPQAHAPRPASRWPPPPRHPLRPGRCVPGRTHPQDDEPRGEGAFGPFTPGDSDRGAAPGRLDALGQAHRRARVPQVAAPRRTTPPGPGSCDGLRVGHVGPVGFQNSAPAGELGANAARSYSVMSPPRICRRLIRSWAGSTGGRSERGGRRSKARCGRCPLECRAYSSSVWRRYC